ncbi:hypothetical protein EUX98_g7696 [Antrodiella citrinella]|uniref:Snurportin-1 n=1 Tax=Antrodiella citrinella TaxID=2447956 RepID=A0A4S4MN80_9APHY|nr:hypothetical protein EUX98_g7696 [Antrodiella citrinella]
MIRSPVNDRKASYKAPPGPIRDAASSQEHRRQKALEEQKRRRAERFDSTRQLDFFAGLSLGHSDDEEVEDAPDVVLEGVSTFAPLLPPSNAVVNEVASPSAPPVHVNVATKDDTTQPSTNGKKKNKNKRKGKGKSSVAKSNPGPPVPGKWGDKCMYAELLEMNEEFDLVKGDGIPDDIESGWVAVAPVPKGKRCLAITHAASGIAGIVPNTTLRSRLLGKPLMKPFPSSLPPHTVLDCILDDGWRNNGILHILDVMKWKGQDIGDCETPFRFWWRDTRLSELSAFPPPAAEEQHNQTIPSAYQFPYPTMLLAIPCHTDTTLPYISNTLIPITRSSRHIPVTIPASTASGMMETDNAPADAFAPIQSVTAEVKSDGLLLYDARSTYEPGTSPLSTWVPIRPYTDNSHRDESMHADEEGPLDRFERLIKRRLEGGKGELHMDMCE